MKVIDRHMNDTYYCNLIRLLIISCSHHELSECFVLLFTDEGAWLQAASIPGGYIA